MEGRASSYRGQIQITLSGLKTTSGETDLSLFLESSSLDPSDTIKALSARLKEIQNPDLRALVDRFMHDRDFLELFRKAPAAKNFHHAYLGGLLEHTLSVCDMACLVADHYPQLNRDLLLAAAFLHDIGKVKEFKYRLQIDYTDEGRLLGHVVLGAGMLDEKLRKMRHFPESLALRLKHLILSHHGQYDFGSPKRPKFLEAFALNLIDDLDAKISGLTRFMEKDAQEGAWTGFNRMFERYLLKGEIASEERARAEADQAEETRQGSLFGS